MEPLTGAGSPGRALLQPAGGPLLRGLEAAVQLFFPGRCRSCGRLVESPGLAVLCAECWEALEGLPGPACPVCALPLARAGADCPDCGRLHPAFDLALAPAPYRGRWRDLIHAYKFESKTSLRRPFCRLMAWKARGEGWSGHAGVVGVPVDRDRLKERGRDQGLELARGLAARLGLPFIPGALRKRPGLRRQSELGRAERLENARGAFSAALPARWRGGRLLLVDDILTTGATAHSCALALKAAGAKGVDVLVLARATLD